MMRLIQIAIASLAMLGCRPQPAPPNEAADATSSRGEAAEPSTPVIRFSAQEPGAPDVGPVRLHIREAGKVVLPQGKVAVSDAFVNDYPLVVAELPPGEYVVQLLVADAGTDERVAAARVRIAGEAAATWRRAGYIAIDSGNGAFFDPRVSSSLDPSTIETFNDTLLKALGETYRNTYSIASLSWQGLTFVGFSTGWGDGRYPVYVGLSTAGSAVSVVIDCEILPW